MIWKLGRKSQARLNDVNHALICVVNTALEISPIDFGITCGLRSLEEQKKLVAKGKSKTMRSLHLIGHAVDIVPFVFGRYQYDWPYFYPVIDAFIQASKDNEFKIEWGGAWNIDMWRCRHAQAAQEMYITAKQAAWTDLDSGGPFLDGPHIQLSTEQFLPDFSKVDAPLSA